MAESNSKTLAVLPNELLHEIGSLLPLSDCLQFCRTCSAFYEVCVALVYATADITSAAQAVKWCNALRMRPRLAGLTRELNVDMRSSYTPLYAFQNILKTSLGTLKRLRVLAIFNSPEFVHALADIHFPELSVLGVMWCPGAQALVESHSAQLCRLALLPVIPLTVQEVIVHGGYGHPVTVPAHTLSLPHLTTIKASIELACTYAASSPRLTSFKISWPTLTVVASRYMELLGTLSRASTDIRHIEHTMYEWHTGLPEAVVENFPDISLLVFEHLGRIFENPLQTPASVPSIFTENLEHSLPKFNFLTVLVLKNDSQPYAEEELEEEDVYAHLDDQFAMVRRFGGARPTLRAITLPFPPTTWLNSSNRNSATALWYPERLNKYLNSFARHLPDPSTMQFLKWFLRTILNAMKARYDPVDDRVVDVTCDLPMQYPSLGIFVFGQQGLRAVRLRSRLGDIPDFELLGNADALAGGVHAYDGIQSRIRFLDEDEDSEDEGSDENE
ncbi:hypothetical protein MKEN_00541400 [Mycena kentingensis (nom. inval.)]|nr:hypothetical protein MKEN_00541400 [Mycena kentingensis (nom. inval.)]